VLLFLQNFVATSRRSGSVSLQIEDIWLWTGK
jgi:hypothetical protein